MCFFYFTVKYYTVKHPYQWEMQGLNESKNECIYNAAYLTYVPVISNYSWCMKFLFCFSYKDFPREVWKLVYCVSTIVFCLFSRWYVHKVWYIMNERRRYSKKRYNTIFRTLIEEKAPTSRLKQISNVDPIKNETLSATG